ncbi:MAG: glycosyltransferase family 39 protein [Elusimicrobia bacterium]|nr:glycosyltransferase family 39 protein [Elusimicrobiota bacterium]
MDRSSAARGLLLLSGVFCLCVALAGPLRDVPLDDDWMYALSVRHLLDGTLVIPEFASPTLVAHAAWGALFCLPRGFSHSALRLSTLVLAWVALALLYLIARRLRLSPKSALASSLALLACPLFLLLSFTFMTDVPFLAASLLAGYCFLRSVQDESGGWLLAASLASAWAFLIRQPGVLIAVGMVLHLAWTRRLDRKRFGLSAAVPLAAVAAHALWFHFIHGQTWASARYNALGTLSHLSQPAGLAVDLTLRLGAGVLMLGAFVVPFVVALLAAPQGGKWLKSKWSLPAALALAFFVYIFGPLPYSPDTSGILNSYGLGTITILGAAQKPAGVFAWRWAWGVLTLLAALGAAYLPTLPEGTEREDRRDLLAAAAALVLPAAPMFFTLRFFDRYLLAPAAFALLAAGWIVSRRPRSDGLLFGAIAAGLLISLAGTVDYLNWNEARWGAAAAAMKSGVPRDEISAGAEWTGTFAAESNMVRLRATKSAAQIRDLEWLEPAKESAYVSFAGEPKARQFKEARTVVYYTPLSRHDGAVHLFKTGAHP